jgi:hypothetical protein
MSADAGGTAVVFDKPGQRYPTPSPVRVCERPPCWLFPVPSGRSAWCARAAVAHDPPRARSAQGQGDRVFYESLFKEKGEPCAMALVWCVEHGLLPADRAEQLTAAVVRAKERLRARASAASSAASASTSAASAAATTGAAVVKTVAHDDDLATRARPGAKRARDDSTPAKRPPTAAAKRSRARDRTEPSLGVDDVGLSVGGDETLGSTVLG